MSEFKEEMSEVARVAMRRLEETADAEEQAVLWQLLGYTSGLENQIVGARKALGL